jgi:hypothetical protein
MDPPPQGLRRGRLQKSAKNAKKITKTNKSARPNCQRQILTKIGKTGLSVVSAFFAAIPLILKILAKASEVLLFSPVQWTDREKLTRRRIQR